MSDIFHEVDEEIRREQLKKLWERYSIFIVGLAVLIVAGIGGWRGYEYYVGKKAAVAGAAFENAVVLSEQGKYAEADTAFSKIVAEAPAGYSLLSRFRAAAALAQTQPADAVKAYDALTADSSIGQTYQDLAAVRAGLLLVDNATLADLQKRLDPIAEPSRTFRHTAREILALSAWRNHDVAAAKRYIDMIAGDGETPPGARARVDVLSALIASDAKS